MSIEWAFYPISALAERAPEWDAINARCGGLPFLESAFLLPLTQQFGNDDELLALARFDGRLAAAALLMRTGFGRWSTWQRSQLPLGAWLCPPSAQAKVARSLLEALPGCALALALTQLDPRKDSRPVDARGVQTLDYIATAWVEVAGEFDAYWLARGKNLRANLKKQRVRLAAEGLTPAFTELRAPGDVAAAIDDYARLESAGWKEQSGTAVHRDNAQGRFYSSALERFCALGRGRIWRLHLGERLAAMDLCIESGDTLVILKTAFDPAFASHSPAFLLKQEAFRKVFDERRIARIEFYGRVMEWHTRWTECSRTLYHANVYRWPFLAALRERLQSRSAPDVADEPGRAPIESA